MVLGNSIDDNKLFFDLGNNLVNAGVGAAVSLKHNQPQLNSMKIVLRAPVGTSGCKLMNAPNGCELVEGAEYFWKPSWELILKDIKEPAVKLEVQWE